MSFCANAVSSASFPCFNSSSSSHRSADFQLPVNSPTSPQIMQAVSSDSRSSAVGCVTLDKVVAKVYLRVWPLDSFGLVS